MLYSSLQFCLITSQLDWTNVSSFPLLMYWAIPMFHFPQFFLSPLMNTTSPFEVWKSCNLCFKLCCLRSPYEYTDVHQAYAFSLHFCTYLDLFLNSCSSMLSEDSSKLTIFILWISAFGVNTKINGRLFRFSSISSISVGSISSNTSSYSS